MGDEIIVAGQPFHTGTRVITWMDPGGYDAYKYAVRVESPPPKGKVKQGIRPAAPIPVLTKPYGARVVAFGNGRTERLAAGDGAGLRRIVDQFVLHYDGSGLSRICFDVLQQRGLSVHFMLDVDGTVYQTMDLEERAAHATVANDRSIGIEIANLGAYPPGDPKAAQLWQAWYPHDAHGRTKLRVPPKAEPARIHTPNFAGEPARNERVRGMLQGQTLAQYDFTPQQYAALIKLAAALCRVFPRLACDCPRDAAGHVLLQKLPDEQLAKFHGILGHFHVQANKQDPGPAFQWDKVISGARAILAPRGPIP
jgi:N-acetyl-anhydromuramyl-L-alanine amidase AmpD